MMLKESRKISSIIVTIIFVLLLVYCCVSLRLIAQIEGDARRINYLGIVRGATQRLVKMELAGRPNDALVAYLDGILTEFLTGQGQNELQKIHDEALRERVQCLDHAWRQVKADIDDFRRGEASAAYLLANSERHFLMADEAVGTAERRSEERVSILKQWLCILSVTMIMAGLSASRYWHNTNRSMEKLAFCDELTGSRSMNYFRLKAPQLLAAERQSQYAMIYMNVNMFSYINNIFGFSAGNEILKLTADWIGKLLDPKRETFARYADDHFLLLAQYVDNDTLVRRLNRMMEEIDRSARTVISDYKISFSVGVYCITDRQEALYKMVNSANVARKKSKGYHQSTFHFYGKDIHEQLLNRQSIESIMYNALERREFIAYLQPKVDLSTHRIAGAEALARWCNSDGQIIPPAQFIPIFEQNGFVTKLDFVIFEQVCAALQRWIAAGITPLPVSVNFSRLHLYDTLLPARIKSIAMAYDVPAKYIELEITESAAIDNMDNFIYLLTELHEAGFKIEIDDFGTGYSSLRLLRELMIDGIKIDKSLIDHIETDSRSRIIVTKVIEMARALGIQTVAEGVELGVQAALLEQIQCDQGQGYLFDRPMTIESFERQAFGENLHRT